MESCDSAHKYIGVCSNEGNGYPSKACAAAAAPSAGAPSAGLICLEELRSLKNILFNDCDEAYPLINKDSNLDTMSNLLLSIVFSDNSDLVSPDCAAEAKPFLCLYFFGLCDPTEGMSYQPSACYCRKLRDNACVDEWKQVEGVLDCDKEFLDESVPCSGDSVSAKVGT